MDGLICHFNAFLHHDNDHFEPRFPIALSDGGGFGRSDAIVVWVGGAVFGYALDAIAWLSNDVVAFFAAADIAQYIAVANRPGLEACAMGIGLEICAFCIAVSCSGFVSAQVHYGLVDAPCVHCRLFAICGHRILFQCLSQTRGPLDAQPSPLFVRNRTPPWINKPRRSLAFILCSHEIPQQTPIAGNHRHVLRIVGFCTMYFTVPIPQSGVNVQYHLVFPHCIGARGILSIR